MILTSGIFLFYAKGESGIPSKSTNNSIQKPSKLPETKKGYRNANLQGKYIPFESQELLLKAVKKGDVSFSV